MTYWRLFRRAFARIFPVSLSGIFAGWVLAALTAQPSTLTLWLSLLIGIACSVLITAFASGLVADVEMRDD